MAVTPHWFQYFHWQVDKVASASFIFTGAVNLGLSLISRSASRLFVKKDRKESADTFAGCAVTCRAVVH